MLHFIVIASMEGVRKRCVFSLTFSDPNMPISQIYCSAILLCKSPMPGKLRRSICDTVPVTFCERPRECRLSVGLTRNWEEGHHPGSPTLRHFLDQLTDSVSEVSIYVYLDIYILSIKDIYITLPVCYAGSIGSHSHTAVKHTCTSF